MRNNTKKFKDKSNPSPALPNLMSPEQILKIIKHGIEGACKRNTSTNLC
jgi:hypothetical protein